MRWVVTDLQGRKDVYAGPDLQADIKEGGALVLSIGHGSARFVVIAYAPAAWLWVQPDPPYVPPPEETPNG